jgi:hypothetical protein
MCVTFILLLLTSTILPIKAGPIHVTYLEKRDFVIPDTGGTANQPAPQPQGQSQPSGNTPTK